MITLLSVLLLGCSVSDSVPPPDHEKIIEEEEFDFNNVELGVQAGKDSSECAQYLGSKVCDIILKDQNDEYFRLYDHEENVIVLDFSTGWCGPCKAAAQTVQTTQDFYDEYGFLYVTIMIEDHQAGTADLGFVNDWVGDFNIQTAPVLQGSREMIDSAGIEGYNLTGWPTFYIIDRNMKIYAAITGFNEEWMTERIEEIL